MIDFGRIEMSDYFHERLGIRYFIHIAENNDIFRPAVPHRPYQLVFLKLVPLMGRHVHRGIFHRHIQDFIRKLRKHLSVFRKSHRLWLSGKSHGRLFDDEFIHIRRHHMKPKLQDIQFIKKRNTVINHFSIPSAFYCRRFHFRQNRNGLIMPFIFFHGLTKCGYCAFLPHHL